MQILHHHNGPIDHRPHGNGDPGQRHNIGIQPLHRHDDKRHQHPHRQTQHCHQRRTHMQQEDPTDQSHHQQLFTQRLPQMLQGPANQAGAIIHCHQLHPIRQPRLQLRQACLHSSNGLLRIFPKAHHHNTAHHFTLTVELSHPTAHLRT